MKTIFESRPNYNDRRVRKRESFQDLEDEHDFWTLYDIASPFSLLAVQGLYDLYTSIKYVAERNIPGDFVESGVFLGGASIFAALARDLFGIPDRKVYMFDTFAGFPEGTTDHVKGRGVVTAGKMTPFRIHVEDNIRHCGVRPGSYHLIEGAVEETLKTTKLPAQISLLRLDTDFYPSTKAEFDYLYPRLVTGGVLIVDDYGLWDGSRRATDEALSRTPILLHRIDATVRSAIKI